MNNRVVVTGYGVLSPFGTGGGALAQALVQNRPAFREPARFETGRFRAKAAAESEFRGGLLDALLICAQSALEMAELGNPGSAALIVGCSGDYEQLQRYWRRREEGGAAWPGTAESVPDCLTDRLAASLGCEGRRMTFNNACIASSQAVGYGYDLIASGTESVALCGGGFLVNEEQYAKFDSGRALSKGGQAKPFCAGRDGMLLGDGAGFLVLEDLAHARARGAAILGEVGGWGFASDAHHVSLPHPDGVGLAAAIGDALKRSGTTASGVGLLQMHGTGSVAGDMAEILAYRLALGEAARSIPAVSTKALTGHMLDGTGVVELIVSLICLERGWVPAFPLFDELESGLPFGAVELGRDSEFRHIPSVLSVNASFGGHNTAILLRQPPGGVA